MKQSMIQKRLIVCLVWLLLLTACTSPSPTTAPLRETAEETSITVQPTYTSPFIPTRTPAPTYTPTQTYTEEELLARRLLGAKAYDTFDCEASFPGCNGTFALRVLEFLHAYPQTSYRTALIERVMDTSIGSSQRLQMEWLIDEWAEQALVGPFQAAGGLPEGFAESWQRGSILPGDLDNDGKNDYVVVAKTLPGTDALSPIWLYWLYERDGQWRQEQLAKAVSSFGMDVLSTGDVNSDGQADLAYTLMHFGASTRTEYLYLLTRPEKGWQRLPVLTRYGNNEPAQNGAWSFLPESDGSTTLVMQQSGPGSNSAGPIVSYRIAFRWQTNAFVPVNISPIENSLGLPTFKIQWADRLAASGRFTETLPVLHEALNENGRGGFYAFYPAFILFRLGMAHLYLEQPAEARAAWAQLVQEYPDMAISRDVSRLSALIDQPVSAAAPAWQVCDWYLRERPDWWLPQTDPALIHYSAGDKYPFDVYTWCDPWLLVTLQPWERAQPLEEQATRLGLDWQPLSDDYDLNGDGLDDPIGLIEGEAWAFLSAGERYQPLYAESELPLGAIREPFHGSPGYPDERTLQVADLDDNGMPEIWEFKDTRLLAWIWQGWHFDAQWDQLSIGDKGYWGKARLANGLVRVRIAEYPYAEERVIGELIYQLVDGSLQRIDPPVQPERSLDTLSAAIEALYRQDDPQHVLQMLDRFDPQAADQNWSDDPLEPDWIFDADWERAAASALRALAYEHLGKHSEAMQEWRLILQKWPEPAWLGLAVDVGGLVRLPTPVPLPTASPMPTPTPGPTLVMPTQPAPQAGIRSLHMIDAHTGWLLYARPYLSSVESRLLRTTDGGHTWREITPPVFASSESIMAATFIDANTAQVVHTRRYPRPTGRVMITPWYTQDGGETWQWLYPTPANEWMVEGLEFVMPDAEHGWLLGTNTPAMGIASLYLLRTQDGGKNWVIAYVTDYAADKNALDISRYYPYAAGHITFLSETLGFFSNNRLYTTQDGGVSWQPLLLDPPADLPDIDCASSGCKYWDAISVPQFSSAQAGVLLRRVYSRAQQAANAFGDANPLATLPFAQYLYLTQDGGLTWVPRLAPAKTGSLYFLDGQRGWMLGKSDANPTTLTQLYRTVDGGVTWNLVSNSCPLPLGSELQFLDERNGFAHYPYSALYLYRHFDQRAKEAAEQGAIFFTRDGGFTWEQVK